jgi:glycosyltransferase involved in cell wall biosynthesis
MEHITNLGSQYTNNYYDQEVTFKYSDYVVLISEAEQRYYNRFGYDKYPAETIVIYNSYKPKYDDVELDVDYESNNIGYIGRHVPRKRPELPLLGVKRSKSTGNIQIFNMGVDYDKYGNDYWKKLERENEELLNVIPFSSDRTKINKYWSSVGANCITGIYEPFGYTMCETLDRRVPAIVQDIDGPSEIIRGLEENVFMYNVNKDDMNKDVENFTEALEEFWNTTPEERKERCENARKALDNFRPETIKLKWNEVLESFTSGSKIKNISDDEVDSSIQAYGYFEKVQQLKFRYYIHDNDENEENLVDLDHINLEVEQEVFI